MSVTYESESLKRLRESGALDGTGQLEPEGQDPSGFFDSMFRPGPSPMGSHGIRKIPAELIDPWRDQDNTAQPFRMYPPEKLEELAENIRQNGILTPVRLRPSPYAAGRYQLLAGHNRVAAAKLAGVEQIPAIVETMDDDAARIILVDSNLYQRETILPSEKAFAYKLKLEAMKHQGKRTDLTSCQVGAKLRSDEDIAKEANESARQIQRYIRLTYLIAPLLELVDKGQLSVRPAVALSYLSPAEQETVCRFCFEDGRHPVTEAHAEQLRRWSEAGEQLTAERLAQLFAPQTAKPPKKVAVPVKSIRRYFRADATEREMQETILKALAQYFEGKEV